MHFMAICLPTCLPTLSGCVCASLPPTLAAQSNPAQRAQPAGRVCHACSFRSEDVLVLTDDQQHPDFVPTRANITRACAWLVGACVGGVEAGGTACRGLPLPFTCPQNEGGM